MPKPLSKKAQNASAPPENQNPKGDKLTSKTAKAAKNKAPERRNENKVRGR